LTASPQHRHPMARLAGTVTRLPRYLNLAQKLARDSRVPASRRVTLVAGIGYVVSPFDLIPGIIPVAGQLDDLAALLIALRHALEGCPEDVAQSHMDGVGLNRTALDADIRTLAVAAMWLVIKAGTLGMRVAEVPFRKAVSAGHVAGAKLATAARRKLP
jgi:uncharacterized membrane protein YkvA (DUF1232 family)